MARTQTVPVRLLREANFRRIWLIGGLGGTVRWLEMLSISVFTFDLTGSPLWVAALMVVRMLPMILFGTIFGAYADRFNRRTLLLVGLVTVCLTTTVVAGLALGERIALWHVALAAFVSGTYFSTDFPVRRTILGELAGDAHAGTAMALDSATNNATRGLGPLLGGIVYQSIGLPGVYLVGACAYAACLGLAALVVHGERRPARPTASVLAEIAQGLRYVRSQRRILGTLLVTAIVNFFGFPVASMVPVIGRNDLELSASWVGLLASAEGTGAFLGALLVAWFSKPNHYGWLYLGGSLVYLTAITCFSLAGGLGSCWSVLVIGGLGVSGFAAMQSAILLTSAAPEYRSRTMGALAVCIGSGPIGVLHLGILAEWFGAREAVRVMSLEGLLAMTLAARYWSGLWRRR